MASVQLVETYEEDSHVAVTQYVAGLLPEGEVRLPAEGERAVGRALPLSPAPAGRSLLLWLAEQARAIDAAPDQARSKTPAARREKDDSSGVGARSPRRRRRCAHRRCGRSFASRSLLPTPTRTPKPTKQQRAQFLSQCEALIAGGRVEELVDRLTAQLPAVYRAAPAAGDKGACEGRVLGRRCSFFSAAGSSPGRSHAHAPLPPKTHPLKTTNKQTSRPSWP